MRLLPRYYLPIYLASLVFLSLEISELSFKKKNFLILCIILINLLCLSVENIHPRFHSKNFNYYRKIYSDCLYVDSKILKRANKYKIFTDKRNFIKKKYYFAYLLDEKDIDKIVIDGDKKVQYLKPPKLLIGQIIDFLKIDHFLDENIYNKLAYRNKKGILVTIKKRL
ncbi:MAG: hypothetical protein ACQEQF_09900 [Bacillota bacterium]